MVWSYTAYLLWKFSEVRGKEIEDNKKIVKFSDFAQFVFDILGRECMLFLHDGEKDLYEDVEYLRDIGAIRNISIEPESKEYIIEIDENLKEIAEVVERFLNNQKKKGLISEYYNRLKKAINCLSSNNSYFASSMEVST